MIYLAVKTCGYIKKMKVYNVYFFYASFISYMSLACNVIGNFQGQAVRAKLLSLWLFLFSPASYLSFLSACVCAVTRRIHAALLSTCFGDINGNIWEISGFSWMCWSDRFTPSLSGQGSKADLETQGSKQGTTGTPHLFMLATQTTHLNGFK